MGLGSWQVLTSHSLLPGQGLGRLHILSQGLAHCGCLMLIPPVTRLARNGCSVDIPLPPGQARVGAQCMLPSHKTWHAAMFSLCQCSPPPPLTAGAVSSPWSTLHLTWDRVHSGAQQCGPNGPRPACLPAGHSTAMGHAGQLREGSFSRSLELDLMCEHGDCPGAYLPSSLGPVI